MSLSEFSLIERYFSRPGGPAVVLGVGDDCALLRVPPGRELAVTVDTLVEGVHFFAGCDPQALGHKALAVSLSDLAAMGAEPAWATLALSLPQSDEGWLQGFSDGLFSLADAFGVALVGGDTSRAPLSITLQLHGLVPAGLALTRAAAQPGDGIWVSGDPGEAALALRARRGQLDLSERWREHLDQRLDRPAPRVAMGLALRDIASAAIDLSDGLAADLGHILARSGVGALLQWEHLPLSPALTAHLSADEAARLVLAGGDDYELCVTVPAARESELLQAAGRSGLRMTRIGGIVAGSGLHCVDAQGAERELPGGFRHF